MLHPRRPLAAMLAMLACSLPAAGAAQASENRSFDCGGPGIAITIELEPETGTATIKSPRGTEQLGAQSDGVWRDATEELQFYADRTPPTLWMGSEQFSCAVQMAGAAQNPASGAGAMVNLPGLSLGGKLRDGPGLEFARVGSLAEGTPLTIVANTGVNFDGYDWFEIRTRSGQTAYQWGGIMCSEGQLTDGIYQQCQ